ncbi:MAG: aldo/keto reductase [Dehalococcoidales bacterium]|nr:aldo/keto reductase [Dehalococcoidales bacterium]
MKYRALGKTGMSVSEVGFGAEHLEKMEYDQVKPVIDAVVDAGINIIDVFMPEPNVRTNIGKALAGRRHKVFIQGHIGAAWINGQYAHTRDLEPSKLFFNDLMTRLQTDYIDIGIFHFVDNKADFEKVFNSAILKYAQELKAKGIIKAIGMSSHNPEVALRAVKTGHLDVLLFSINPAFDLLPADTDIETFFHLQETFQTGQLKDINPVRRELYETCETMGVGITVMKGLGAGALLRAESSPFGVALTTIQCLHYALTRPGVASMMLGARTPEEIRISARYSDASDKERDYSVVLASTPRYSLDGKCMYCNHCLPCPSEIDIAQAMKYLDLALGTNTVPDSLRHHYSEMSSTAADCVECGSCESNCPFKVPVIQRMKKAVDIFGK